VRMTLCNCQGGGTGGGGNQGGIETGRRVTYVQCTCYRGMGVGIVLEKRIKKVTDTMMEGTQYEERGGEGDQEGRVNRLR
jgi:hypothetical protein